MKQPPQVSLASALVVTVSGEALRVVLTP